MTIWSFTFFNGIGRLLESAFGAHGKAIIYGAIFCIAITLYIYKGFYRDAKLYKSIMGDKAKPYPYDEKGKRIYRWNGTPIEPPEEAKAAAEETADEKNE